MSELELVEWELSDSISELICSRWAGENENSKHMLDLKVKISNLEEQLYILRNNINRSDREELLR